MRIFKKKRTPTISAVVQFKDGTSAAMNRVRTWKGVYTGQSEFRWWADRDVDVERYVISDQLGNLSVRIESLKTRLGRTDTLHFTFTGDPRWDF